MLHGTQAGIAGSISLAAKSRWRALLFGAVSIKSGAATGNLWIGKLACRAGFRSSFRQTSSRTSSEHEICTVDLASTLLLWIRSGYAWSTKRLSEKTWSECVQLGIPDEFDIAQISWRPDYDPFFYRELSRRARRVYLFRDEYIFEVEKAVVVETPQLGHATYVFAKPRDMHNFLARYTKTTKTGIRRNQDNVGEQLG